MENSFVLKPHLRLASERAVEGIQFVDEKIDNVVSRTDSIEDDVSILKEFVRNNNFLDNAYWGNSECIINQRNQTEYTVKGYTIDRWYTNDSGLSVTIESDSIKLTNSNMSTSLSFIQYVPAEQFKIGKYITFSVATKNNNVFTVSGFAGNRVVESTDFGRIIISHDTTKKAIFAQIEVQANTSASFIAAKLEQGTRQTIANKDDSGNWVLNDPPPNKTLELLKCQKYQFVFSDADYTYVTIGIGFILNSTAGRAFVPLPVSLYKKPTISVEGSWQIYTPSIHILVSNVLITAFSKNMITLDVEANNSLEKGTMVGFRITKDQTAKIIFDANL